MLLISEVKNPFRRCVKARGSATAQANYGYDNAKSWTLPLYLEPDYLLRWRIINWLKCWMWKKIPLAIRLERYRLITFSWIVRLVQLETDDQIENANKFMKNYLRAYVRHAQDDWVNYLSETEFAVNNHVNIFTEMTFFFVDHEYHSRNDVESLE